MARDPGEEMQAKLSGKKRSLSKAEGTIADDNRFLGFQRGQRLKLRPRLRMSHLVESAVAVFMEGRARDFSVDKMSRLWHALRLLNEPGDRLFETQDFVRIAAVHQMVF